MRILMLASEAAPFSRTSDVANVVAKPSHELQRRGHGARLVLPFYCHLKLVEAEMPRPVWNELAVPRCLCKRCNNKSRMDYRPHFDKRMPACLADSSPSTGERIAATSSMAIRGNSPFDGQAKLVYDSEKV
jgi:hypothetical protein